MGGSFSLSQVALRRRLTRRGPSEGRTPLMWRVRLEMEGGEGEGREGRRGDGGREGGEGRREWCGGAGRGGAGLGAAWRGDSGKMEFPEGRDLGQRKVAGHEVVLGGSQPLRKVAPEWKDPEKKGPRWKVASKGRSDERSQSSVFENSSFFLTSEKAKATNSKVRHLIKCTVEFDRNSFRRSKHSTRRGRGGGGTDVGR